MRSLRKQTYPDNGNPSDTVARCVGGHDEDEEGMMCLLYLSKQRHYCGMNCYLVRCSLLFYTRTSGFPPYKIRLLRVGIIHVGIKTGT